MLVKRFHKIVFFFVECLYFVKLQQVFVLKFFSICVLSRYFCLLDAVTKKELKTTIATFQSKIDNIQEAASSATDKKTIIEMNQSTKYDTKPSMCR